MAPPFSPPPAPSARQLLEGRQGPAPSLGKACVTQPIAEQRRDPISPHPFKFISLYVYTTQTPPAGLLLSHGLQVLLTLRFSLGLMQTCRSLEGQLQPPGNPPRPPWPRWTSALSGRSRFKGALWWEGRWTGRQRQCVPALAFATLAELFMQREQNQNLSCHLL